MTKLHRLSVLFGNTFRVAVFYLLMIWWGIQIDPMISELYIVTPFIVFSCVAVFLFLFLCRGTGCLLFMEKSRLKAILRNGEPEPTASQLFLRLFSFPFLKRVTLYFVLFVLEFYLRLLCIKLFLMFVQGTLPFWEKITGVSEGLLCAGMFLGAYVIMEVPAWLLFYKLSFRGRSNRSSEYRFGMKLSFLVSLIIGLRFLSLSLTADASPAVENVAFVLFAALSFGLWYLMYRKKWCCCNTEGCRICNAVKGLFGKKKETVKEEPAETPEEKPEQPATEPEKAEEIPAETPEKENGPEKTEETPVEILPPENN